MPEEAILSIDLVDLAEMRNTIIITKVPIRQMRHSSRYLSLRREDLAALPLPSIVESAFSDTSSSMAESFMYFRAMTWWTLLLAPITIKAQPVKGNFPIPCIVSVLPSRKPVEIIPALVLLYSAILLRD